MVSREAGEGASGALLGIVWSRGALDGALLGGWGPLEGEAKRSSALEGGDEEFCSIVAKSGRRVKHQCVWSETRSLNESLGLTRGN